MYMTTDNDMRFASLRSVCFFHRQARMSARLSSYALLFPGQGSQHVGMTRSLQRLPMTQYIFSEAQRVLGYDLQTLCLEGPQERLDKTVHCQPAVVVASLVALAQLELDSPQVLLLSCIKPLKLCSQSVRVHYEQELSTSGFKFNSLKVRVLSNCVAAAGFSVGEITALIFAQSLSLEQGLQLMSVRAEAMQAACEEEAPSVMSSITNLNTDTVQAQCDIVNATMTPSPQVCIANYMFPRGLVVSGGRGGVRSLEQWAVTQGGVVKQVPVSGAFHSTFMNSAVPKLTALLKTLDISLPKFPVISNVTARPYSSVEEIRRLLGEQVTRPVLWEDSVRGVLQRPLTFVEVGPGKQLKAMLGRIDKNAFRTCISVTV